MVPKLRFSFTSALSPYKLGVLTKWSSGGTPSKDNKSYWDGDISWFTAASMKDNVLSVSPTKISDLGLANGSRLANKNDILLLVRGSMLFNKIPVGVLLNDAAFNQDVKAIKCLEKFNHRFALQWFLSKESHLLGMVTGTGIGAGKLDTSELQNLDVYLPDDVEQSKIADFLSSVDEKIALLTKQYKLLCQYKKGMIQKIFNQELRFIDQFGISYPDWKKIKFSEIGSFYRGHSYTATDVTQKEDLLVLRSNNIQNNKVDYSTGLQFVTKSCKKDILLKNNDIIICMANGSKSLVGKSAEFLSKDTDFRNVTVGAFCSLFRSTDSLAKYLFQTEKYYNEIDLLLEGSNINNLKNSTLEGISFLVPTSPSEKLKIVSLLASIDNKINKKLKELDLIKTWKQGLLQQMFV